MSIAFRLATLLTLMMTLALPGCSRRSGELIDLDKVIVVFQKVLEQPIDAEKGALTPEVSETADAVPEVAAPEEQSELNDAFLALFVTELNNANIHSNPLGARFDTDGSIVGFTDLERDGARNGQDSDLFRIVFDGQRGRVIVSDLQNPTYNRDHHYGHYYHRRPYYGSGGGFWAGYMLGSMRSRQYGYYARPGRAFPNYSRMNISPRGYHASASSFRSSSSGSARSRSGSRSFRGGK